MDNITWSVGSNAAPNPDKKLEYVSTWKVFSKLPEDEKEKRFNEMRADLIILGRMENK